MATPEQARGWLRVIMPLLERATPATLALALLLGGIMGWYLARENSRLHGINRELFDKLEAAYEARLKLALTCGREEGGIP